MDILLGPISVPSALKCSESARKFSVDQGSVQLHDLAFCQELARSLPLHDLAGL